MEEDEPSDKMAKVITQEIGTVIQEEPLLERVDDTYTINSDALQLSFVVHVDDKEFEIRDIERRKPGIGAAVVRAIHDFCDERDMKVVASNVSDTTAGFWRKMGYQEGSNGTFFRAE